jgi:hypothetical protein
VVLGVVMLAAALPGWAAATPAAVPAPQTWLASHGMWMPESQYPWFDGQALPKPVEEGVLKTAREAVEADAGVIAATKNYEACFAAANSAIRAVMLKNPLSDAYLDQVKNQQQVHDVTWILDMDVNSRDILLPNPPGVPDGAMGIMRLRFSGRSNGLPGANSPEGIRRMALREPAAMAALQKVRDAYQALDEAVRAAMRKDAAVAALISAYPELLYGRRDLGFAAGGFVQV